MPDRGAFLPVARTRRPKAGRGRLLVCGTLLLALAAAPGSVASGPTLATDQPASGTAITSTAYGPPVVFDDFSLDPHALPDQWHLGGRWRWRLTDGSEGGVLIASPLKRNLAWWLPDLFREGKVSARLKLVRGLDGTPPRAGVIFSRQPETGAYRYVLLKAGKPGAVILGQRGMIGSLDTGVVARAKTLIPRRAWMLLEVEILEEGGVNVFLDGSLVLAADAAALPPAEEGGAGLRGVKSKAIFDEFAFHPVEKPPPLACFEAAPSSPLRGQNVFFDAACSTAAEGLSIVSWEWDFDYGGTFSPDAVGPVSSHVYLDAGTHTVALVVADDAPTPRSGILTLALEVSSDPSPTACFTVSPNPGLCGEEILFDGSCSTHASPLRSIASWEWDFDYDGAFSADAAGQTASNVYGAMGQHTAALRVTDDAEPPLGDLATRAVTVQIVNRVPVPDGGGPYCASTGRGITLDASGSADPDEGCGDEVVSWEWDLDDDGVHDDASGERVSLTWEEIESLVCGGSCLAGSDYPVALRVTDSLGGAADRGTLVSVVEPVALACAGCHAGSPPAGFELAPDVMTYWDGTWWDGTYGGNPLLQEGGHGDPGGAGPLTCSGATGCHDDFHLVPGCGNSTHQDGVLQGKGRPTANTYHLRDAFIAAAPVDPWDVQVTFDNACAGLCHAGAGVPDMRHEENAANPGDPDYLAIEFGTHLTRPDGDSIEYPIDSDLTTRAPTDQPDYAPCISCHDPHGTGVDDVTGFPAPDNHMLRDKWMGTSKDLCAACHI